MRVEEIMTRAVKTAAPDADGQIVGIISEKDVLHHMFPNVQELMETGLRDLEALEHNYNSVIGLKAADLMTQAVATVAPDMPVLKAAAMMWLQKVRRIPVAVDGRLTGIISIGDVHRAIFQSNLMADQSRAAHG